MITEFSVSQVVGELFQIKMLRCQRPEMQYPIMCLNMSATAWQPHHSAAVNVVHLI